MGLSIALHLCRNGTKPVVLEKSFSGAGSSGKSGAILRQHYSSQLHVSMARESLEKFRNFRDYCGGPSGFVNSGMVLVVDAPDRGPFDASLSMQRSLGVDTQLVEGDSLSEAAPGTTFGPDAVGCYEPEAGYVDPLLTMRTLTNAVRDAGGEVRVGETVTSLEAGETVTGIATDKGRLSCNSVVLAAGAWSGRLLEDVGVDLPIEPSRVQSGVFRRPSGYDGGPVLIDFPNRMYAKHAADTHVGSLSPDERAVVDPDGFDQTADSEYVNTARSRMLNRFHAMQHSLTMGGYGAIYAVTPDWHAAIGPVGPDGLYVCAGFSGHGFKLAPSVGETVAAEIVGRDPQFDLSSLRPGRFEQGALLKPGYAYSIMG